jgi:hypothetical protein
VLKTSHVQCICLGKPVEWIWSYATPAVDERYTDPLPKPDGGMFLGQGFTDLNAILAMRVATKRGDIGLMQQGSVDGSGGGLLEEETVTTGW